MNIQLSLFETETKPKRIKQPKLYTCPQATKIIRKALVKSKHSRVLSALVKLGFVEQENNLYRGLLTLEQINESIKYIEDLQ